MFGIALATVLLLFVSVQAEFPDDPKPCKYGDGECIMELCNTLFNERSSEANPGLNLPRLDPLKIDKMVISQGESASPVGITLTFTDNLLYGIKDQRIVKVKGFGKDLTAKHEVKIVTKIFSLVGPYDIKGKVLILPISGSGQSNLTLVNTKAILSFWGKPLEKNGEIYLDVTDLKIAMKPESIHYHFSNLFNGDKALGDNMNVFLNENSEAIYKETASSINRSFGEFYLGIVKGVFSKWPYAKLFAPEYIQLCFPASIMKLTLALVLLLGCASVSVHGHASELPSGIERCGITDEQCLMNGVNFVLRNYAKSGIKELGLIPLDPLHIKKFKIGRNPHSPVNIDLSFHDVDLLGLQEGVAKRVSGFTSDLSRSIELVMEVPELTVKGPYSVEGRILILPITGKGNAEIRLKKTKVRALIKFKRVSKGEHQTFAEVVNINVEVDPAHVTYHLENLFNGQKDLSENMHALINENWKDIFNELKPGIGEAFGLIAKSVLDRIFGKLPLEQLFTV
ncbi:uncharacterized protein LOC108113805 [Drosophila eugracilis]|uniref:uncharacterized protein LOC108113805 n=1 Tax=Drosophila eugracilis TaxID=29029 RepID=UPI001BD9D264|nr:uncharacterized protein LOC108113805 [Drosophila eugracilis]